MSLLSVIIALLLDRFLPDTGRFRARSRYLDVLNWLGERLNAIEFLRGFPAAALVIIAGPIVLVWVLDLLSADNLFSDLLVIAASAAVLFWSLSWRELSDATEAFTDAFDRQQYDEAMRRADDLDCQINQSQLNHAPATMLTHGLAQSTERLFGVLFWFVALGGPVGSLLYISTVLLRQQLNDRAELTTARQSMQPAHTASGTSAASSAMSPLEAGTDADDPAQREFTQALIQMNYWLNWIPTRLAAAAFVLVGSFEDALNGWRSHGIYCLGRFQDDNAALTVCTGLGALGHDHDCIRQRNGAPASANAAAPDSDTDTDPDTGEHAEEGAEEGAGESTGKGTDEDAANPQTTARQFEAGDQAEPSSISTQDTLAGAMLISRALVVWLITLIILTWNGVLA